jgi:predicted nucleotidyltransferase
MTRKKEVLDKLRQILPNLQTRWHVRSLDLFGSVARAEDNSDSDVDLIVHFEPDAHLSFFVLDSLALEIERELGMPSDLATSGSIKPSFRKMIEKDIIHVEN